MPGKDVPKNRLGTHQAGLIVKERRDNADVIVDMGGGYGGPIVNHLSENNDIECMGYKGAAASTKRTADRKYGFTNTRSAAYWAMREALDPDQPGGSKMYRPPARRLPAGLCAPTYEVKGQEIKIDAADGIKINGSNLKARNMTATNGVYHAIDTVLMPAAAATQS